MVVVRTHRAEDGAGEVGMEFQFEDKSSRNRWGGTFTAVWVCIKPQELWP